MGHRILGTVAFAAVKTVHFHSIALLEPKEKICPIMTNENFEKINQHLKQLHAGGAKREKTETI